MNSFIAPTVPRVKYYNIRHERLGFRFKETSVRLERFCVVTTQRVASDPSKER